MSNILAEDGKRNSSGEYAVTTLDLTDTASVLFQSFLTQRNFPMTWMSSLPAFLLIH